MTLTRKHLAWLIVGIGLCAALTAPAVFSIKPPAAPAPMQTPAPYTSQLEPSAIPIAGWDSGLTLANYSRVQIGMSYAEVTAILGHAGVEKARNNIAGFENVFYEWREGMRAMNGIFQNGRLVQKAQFGLQ